MLFDNITICVKTNMLFQYKIGAQSVQVRIESLLNTIQGFYRLQAKVAHVEMFAFTYALCYMNFTVLSILR